MTESTLKKIVHRAVKDGSFRAQLQRDPAKALAGFDLTADERSAIAAGDPARLTALGIDQRMSKAFAVGVLGDASKVIATDVTGAFAGGAAFIDEGSAAGGRGIVGDPIAPSASLIDRGASVGELHMKLVEQDLDVGAGVAAEPAGEKYLTEDEALLAYQASLAASVGTSVSTGLMAADGTSIDPGYVSAESASAANEVVGANQDSSLWTAPDPEGDELRAQGGDAGYADSGGSASDQLRRIEQDLDTGDAPESNWVDPAVDPTEY